MRFQVIGVRALKSVESFLKGFLEQIMFLEGLGDLGGRYFRACEDEARLLKKTRKLFCPPWT